MGPSRIKGLLAGGMLAIGMIASGGGVVHADSATVVSTALLSPTYYTGVVARGSTGGVVSLNTSRSVSHTRSGSVGVSWNMINAAAGFSVTETFTVTYSSSRSAPPWSAT